MLRDYDTEEVMGHVVYYTLEPFQNHSRTQYKRKYKSALRCNQLTAHILGWIWVKTGFYIYG